MRNTSDALFGLVNERLERPGWMGTNLNIWFCIKTIIQKRYQLGPRRMVIVNVGDKDEPAEVRRAGITVREPGSDCNESV
jgi:hypothetical protein